MDRRKITKKNLEFFCLIFLLLFSPRALPQATCTEAQLGVNGGIRLGDPGSGAYAPGTMRYLTSNDRVEFFSAASGWKPIGQAMHVNTGKILNGQAIPNPPAGYSRSNCHVLVTAEDTHVTANGASAPNYSGGFGDSGSWSDNHYGGWQAFADSNWQVTCRYIFIGVDNANLVWIDGNCRYMMVCK